MTTVENTKVLKEFTQPILNSDVPEVLGFLNKYILPEIGLYGLDEDAAIIGSAGKKLLNQTSGDIDIAILRGSVAKHFDRDDVLMAIHEKLSSMGYRTNIQKGFSQVNVALPAPNGFVQVDLMITDNLDWAKFVFHSPDYTKSESNYRGVYRGMLLNAVASEIVKKTVKKLDGEIEEYEQYVIRSTFGLFKVRKTLLGKNGKLIKTPKLLDKYEQRISNNPIDAVKLLFGKDVRIDDISTFEKMLNVIKSQKFLYPGKVGIIKNKFMWYLGKTNLNIPSEITNIP